MTIHRSIQMVAVAGLLIAAIATSASARSSESQSILEFNDPAGDASGAPDITAVDLSGNAATGQITFHVVATGLVPATADGRLRAVDFWLNTDRNASTGNSSGAEFLLCLWTGLGSTALHYALERWGSDGSFDLLPGGASLVGASGNDFSLLVNTAALDGATSFSFQTRSMLQDEESYALLAADDAGGVSVYGIAGPTRSLEQVLWPTFATPIVTPARVVAGKRVTVSMRVSWNPDQKTVPLTDGRMVCDPSTGGKVIVHRESFTGGVVKLSFVVPKTAAKKKIEVKVTIKPPSYRAADGTWYDPSTSEIGVLGNYVRGVPATKVVTIPVR